MGRIPQRQRLLTQAPLIRQTLAIRAAIEGLESRLLMTVVTYNVITNGDTAPPLIIPTGPNIFTANTLRAALTSAPRHLRW